ncbi:hypothetical protein KC973_02570 [Candidatus Saccharibacteria bacterium]|nr:hypothetical protein [Candidatus Saccharibacteria bacterium]
MSNKLREVAIEGVDGVGKTSVATALAQLLEAYGEHTYMCNPFHTARALNEGVDIYTLWQTPEGASQAINLLKAAIEDERGHARRISADTIIYDRHWMTAFTEIGDNPGLVQEWGDEFPHTALLLDARSEEEQRRNANNHGDRWDAYEERERYKKLYRELSYAHREHMLGAYLITWIPEDFKRVARTIDGDIRYRR